jgi:DNA-binding response OmpR family regulator
MQKAEKILIIEDDFEVQFHLNTLLSEAGYQVYLSGDGKSGCHCARFVRPDLILLDIEMPVLNGYDTCKMLRNRDATIHTPIFFLTGNVDESAIMKGFRSGCDRFITKPYDSEALLYLIKSRLYSIESARLNQLRRRLQSL